MIKGIEITSINEKDTYLNEDKGILHYLGDINKINIFVGANNSSKSRFLRSILSNDNCKFYMSDISLDRRADISAIIHNNYDIIEQYYKIHCQKNIKNILDRDVVSQAMYLHNVLMSIDIVHPLSSDGYLQDFLEELEKVLSLLQYNADNVASGEYNEYLKKYIPILRGIENYDKYYDIAKDKKIDSISMNKEQRDAFNNYENNAKRLYLNKISSVYKIPENRIFTGETIYDDVSKKLLGKKNDRQLINDFQKLISEHFYDGQTFEIIPQLEEKVLNVRIGKHEHPLHDLGDGIKQMIVMLYDIYINKDNYCLFFIEEPEINFHPGFQRKFIDILQNKIFDKHQYFITTHSNHLIDSSLNYDNISIYKIINNENEKFSIISTSKNDIDMLDQLGVSNSSIFVSNCTIWVEGISDKIIIKKYLDIYLDSIKNTRFKEDIHYSFVEYGGNNITHWSFDNKGEEDRINVSGITNRAFIIVDNDNGKNKKRKKTLKAIFHDRFYELKTREIENTISKKTLDSIFSEEKNDKYIDYEEKDFQNNKEYMGKFIDKHFPHNKKWSSKKGSGTIRYKLEFAKLVSKNTKDITYLSKEAKTICKNYINL